MKGGAEKTNIFWLRSTFSVLEGEKRERVQSTWQMFHLKGQSTKCFVNARIFEEKEEVTVTVFNRTVN